MSIIKMYTRTNTESRSRYAAYLDSVHELLGIIFVAAAPTLGSVLPHGGTLLYLYVGHGFASRTRTF